MSAASTTTNRRPRSRRGLISLVLSAALLVLLTGFASRPVRVYYYQYQGRQALSNAEYAHALANFRAAREIDPMNSETGFWLARACRKTGDLDGVRNYLDESQRHGYPDKKRLKREWWLVLAETGRIQEVEQHLTEMLLNPGDDGSEICDAFSKGYCLNLKFPQAHQILDAWAAEYPRDYRPYLRRAQIFAGSKQWALAIAELRQAQNRAPEEVAIHRELGHCLYKNDETAEAEQHLQAVIRREPTDVSTLMSLAQIAFDRNDHRDSVNHLKLLVAAQPLDFPARLLQAKVYLAMGEPARSVEVAESLVAEWPEDLSAHYVLAQALRAAGRLEDAKRHFVIHAELDKKWARIETIGREMNQHPSDPQLRYELGVLLLRHVSRSEGVAYLESVFQFVSTHTEAHRALAEYYDKVGNHVLSLQHRQLANTSESAASILSTSRPGDRPE